MTTAFKILCLLPWCLEQDSHTGSTKKSGLNTGTLQGTGWNTFKTHKCSLMTITGQLHCVSQWQVSESGKESGRKGERQVRREVYVLGCILYLPDVCACVYANARERVWACVWTGVCDNDGLSPHSDVGPEPALILIHYLYFHQLAHIPDTHAPPPPPHTHRQLRKTVLTGFNTCTADMQQ